ncbi:hypothetical protein QQ045_012038 [Rhodiola kirilowii]
MVLCFAFVPRGDNERYGEAFDSGRTFYRGPELLWTEASTLADSFIGGGHVENSNSSLLYRLARLPKLIKSDYQRLYDFFYESATPILDSPAENGISREEACHNLVFASCFNSFGGMKIFFTNMLKWIGRSGLHLHTKLAAEIRSAVRSNNNNQVTVVAIERMPSMSKRSVDKENRKADIDVMGQILLLFFFLKSTCYECFRIEPPVPLQYGKEKCDLIIESHDSTFEPLATRDPKIFEQAKDLVRSGMVHRRRREAFGTRAVVERSGDGDADAVEQAVRREGLRGADGEVVADGVVFEIRLV